jgi:hypothetical protein
MKFTVRTQEGELIYSSFGAVEQAYLAGLVGPEDELLEEGATQWRKACSYPVLKNARRQGNQVWGGTQLAWIMIGVLLGSVALYLLTHGGVLLGAVIAIIVTSLLFRVTFVAFRKSKPHL